MDSFLLTHRVNDFLFDIASGFTPIGIRDQMVRGFLIATRLLAEKRIGPALPLLIVGAGAGGATAALIAATNDVPTLMVEKASQPFSRQLYCPTRFLSPSEYDWPGPAWNNQKFPQQGLSFPFEWTSNYAAVIAASWRAKLYREARINSNLRLRLSWRLKSPELLPDVTRDDENLFRVTLEDEAGNIESERVAVAVACTGPGKERCTPANGPFVGVSFWQPDTLQEPGFGLSGVSHPRIFLSGGGDGTLQDFLRVVSSAKSAGEILAALPEETQKRLSTSILEVEEHFSRGFLWDTTKYNCRTSHLLHKAYTDVAQKVLTTGSATEIQALERQLLRILRPVPKDFTVHLVHPCSHFTLCYPLNRILVLLIAEFIKRTHGVDLIHPFTQVLQIRSENGHGCGPNMVDCKTSPHYVDLAVARCVDINERLPPVAREPIEELEGLFHHVILRHGIRRKNYFGRMPLGNPKEVLPAYVELDWY